MDVKTCTQALCSAIRDSEECKEYERLREIAEQDDTNRLLLKELRRLQMALQMQAMGGPSVSEEDTQRFASINSLLYMNADVTSYLLSEMRVQKMLGEIITQLSEAAGASLGMELA